jgi:hypothetical protein
MFVYKLNPLVLVPESKVIFEQLEFSTDQQSGKIEKIKFNLRYGFEILVWFLTLLIENYYILDLLSSKSRTSEDRHRLNPNLF